MLRLSAAEAFGRFESNHHARWAGAPSDPATSVGQRRVDSMFTPSISDEWVKGFEIGPTDPLFAIGSCFARGIEVALVSEGFEVSSYADEFDSFELASDQVTGRGFTNKYSTFSIVNELKWALDPAAPFPIESLVELPDGTAIDPHVNPTLKWLPLEPTIARHGVISDVYQRVTDARVVVVTLGLVESWLDTHTGDHLNMSPTREMIDLHPDRYEFAVTDFAANRQQLDEISTLLRTHADGDVDIVVTVSPVPLNATFSGRDVVAANAYSKAVLRAAAEEWCYDETNVHYFPSYEIVTTSRRRAAWMEDGRHVQGPIVGGITRLFRATYVPGTSATPSAVDVARDKLRPMVDHVPERHRRTANGLKDRFLRSGRRLRQ